MNIISKIKSYLSQTRNKIIKISDEDISIKLPFPWSVFRYFLFFLSNIYGALVFIRLWLYQKNILKSKRVPCFVISIGNIVAGGSGKTPMAIYLAEMVKSMGFKPAVVSRGYGGNIKKTYSIKTGEKYDSETSIKQSCSGMIWNECAVAGDGERVFFPPQIVGDEPFMMASRRSFPVIVGKNRFKAAMLSLDLLKYRDLYLKSRKTDIETKGTDLIILDDGLQHIGLKRDLEIVLLDYNRPFGNGYLLPAGRLREVPAKAMRRADIVIFTRYSGTETESYKEITERHKTFGNVFFKTSHRPFLHCFFHKKIKLSTMTLEDLKGRKAFLFSGIADNRSFRKTIENLDISVKAHLEFNDHHMYKSNEFFMIAEEYYRVGADLIITTEKDYARLGVESDIIMSSFDKTSSGAMHDNYSSTDENGLNDIFGTDFAVIGIKIDFLGKEDAFATIIKKNLS